MINWYLDTNTNLVQSLESAPPDLDIPLAAMMPLNGFVLTF
ncbi:MAG: hypothetical protein U9R51_07455 [Actinomycetota bacterium]|nr:hypothetical protein [Actinomycetota bacterium]